MFLEPPRGQLPLNKNATPAPKPPTQLGNQLRILHLTMPTHPLPIRLIDSRLKHDTLHPARRVSGSRIPPQKPTR